jgi:arylsulfatase A-like enzyme
MIVRWKGKIEAGKVNNQPWAFWDFLPTAAAIAGVEAPKNIDGISMLPTLLGKKQDGHEFFYWEFHEGGSKQAVRMGDWKAVRTSMGNPLELYHLGLDAEEKNNIAKEHPEIIEKMVTYLKTARTESATWPLKEGKKASTPAKKTEKNVNQP